jgi:alpha-tubulin suppressor-like RCC1 family protein
LLSQDGQLYAWGNHIGAGSPAESPSPAKIDVPDLNPEDIISLATGERHTLAVTKDNKIWAWGNNSSGQLGTDGGTGGVTRKLLPASYSIPGVTVVRVAAGGNFSAAVTEDGQIYFWGYEAYGSFGREKVEGSLVPARTPFNKSAIDVACGYNHTLVLTSSMEVYATGYNTNGCLGIGTTSHTYELTKVRGLERITKIGCGAYHSLALSETGELFTFGWNNYLNLGLGHKTDVCSPTLLLEGVRDIAVGWGHNLAIFRSGELYVWGYNGSGQLGRGDEEQVTRPIQIKFPCDLAAIGCGHDTSFAITSAGEAYVWGRGHDGMLGLGPNNTTNKRCPYRHPLAVKWKVPWEPERLWRVIMVWLFLGRADATSPLSFFPIEVLYHFTIVAFNTLRV